MQLTGVIRVNSNVMLNYSSTLEGAVLTLTCENDTSTDEQALNVTCHCSGSWIPDPAQFTCSSSILKGTTRYLKFLN